MKKTEFRIKCERLFKEAFTSDFYENNICLDTLLDGFHKEELDCYDNGEVLSFIVNIENNKDQLTKIIRDLNAYKEVSELRFHTNIQEDEIDLVLAIEYIENTFSDYIKYNINDNKFYYGE